MNRQRQFPAWSGAVLGTVCALLVLALGAHASDHSGSVTEEFHQTYALAADGRVELDNINGAVHISSWDRNEVKVDAVKYAGPKDRLAEAPTVVEAGTVSGGIDNDFGLHVNHHRFVGHDLRGELGSGGPRIKLSNVNGRIEIRHASDGRALSPVKDLSHRDRDNDDEDDSEI